MSRLTASPFHKPSPFEFPKVPPSPPETNADMIGPARVLTAGYTTGAHEQRTGDAESLPGVTNGLESAGSRFRRGSSIAYHTSSIRESPARTPQRGPKAFIIVIPPSTFNHEHGQLGNTLSSGPRHRLSQGLLMPLFPTMYGQLTAIAREFNFPSTTGLCLYIQITENGVTMTPRISDDTWQFIWNHVLETATPSLHRSPISGRIEFDIDLSQARWYTSWMSSSHRDHAEIPFSTNPSAAPSIAHFRGESKSTSIDELPEERSSTPTRPFVRSSGTAMSTTRHVPRKLSLVDRYDTTSIRSGSRRSALSPPEPVQPTSQTLSPIVQEDEPKSARNALDSRVISWRASAILKPTPLAATGQTSLEPANMPNMLPIDDNLISTPSQELNLADFTWSISSLGPDEDEPISPISGDRLPSIHIAHRMQGSVCMTPSDCTSFGPSDYTLPSPVVSPDRLPTPDIAHRMYEDVPPTPSTVTSWGAPFSYPPSPVNYPRALSVDLGDRCVFSRPTTPATATSWGPESWPSSPISVEWARSIHIADRGECSRPVTPSTVTSWGAPLSFPPSPSTPYFPHTPDVGQRTFEEDGLSIPYDYKPWGHSWPYNQIINSSGPSKQYSPRHMGRLQLTQVLAYPCIEIYPPVYPHFDLYPLPAGAMLNRLSTSSVHPVRAPPDVAIKLRAVYPSFDIYPSVYPGNLEEIYPAIIAIEPSISMSSNPPYPFFDIYPVVCSRIVPFSNVPAEVEPRVYSSQRAPQYPDFDLYPAIPNNNTEIDRKQPRNLGLYRSSSPLTSSTKTEVMTVRINMYPSFDLYPVVYPAFDIYPRVEYEIKFPYNENRVGYPYFDLYPPVHSHPILEKRQSSPDMNVVSVNLDAYPVFNIYPALYPSFNIYPMVDLAPRERARELSVRLSTYPVFDLYPAVYPAFNIYPMVHREHNIGHDGGKARLPQTNRIKHTIKAKELSNHLSTYPVLNIYPAVYPFFDIYPMVDFNVIINEEKDCVHDYPHFDLYPPPVPASDVMRSSSQDTTCSPSSFSVYPITNPYPVFHSDFNIESSGESNFASHQDGKFFQKTIEISVYLNSYPVFDLYPTPYPVFTIYPVVPDYPSVKYGWRTEPSHPQPHSPQSRNKFETSKHTHKSLSVRVQRSYPSFDLYPPVYPFIEIYPHLPNANIEPASSYSTYPDLNLYPIAAKHVKLLSRRTSPSTKYLHYPTLDIYPTVYPHFDLYPPIPVIYTGGLPAVNVRIDPQYPTFDLYPAIYPHFELWPPINQPQIAPYPKPSSRLTHSELHAMVMMESVGSIGSFWSLAEEFTHDSTKVRKSHDDLHREVFPRRDLYTPSGTRIAHPTSGPVDPSRAESRLRQLGLRPPSAKLGLPSSPSPSRGLPAPPMNGSRLSSAFETIPTLVFENGSSLPSRTSPIRISPIKRSPSSRSPLQGAIEHGPRMHAHSTLTRSSSMNTSSPAAQPENLDRSQSFSTTMPPTRRRDSVVFQRVKAYNASQENITLTMETLAQFPAPPLPPLPTTRAPKALDRSKYPFV